MFREIEEDPVPIQRPYELVITEEFLPTLHAHGFRYIKPLGHGAFGTAHLIQSNRYNCEFCVKVSCHNGEFSPTRESEITALKNVSHPNVIIIYEYFLDEKYLFIVLEYCPGGTLLEKITNNEIFMETDLYSICRQLLMALSHCHTQGIAHRDIKPENVLIDGYGRPKLADFGLSRTLCEGEMIQSRAGSRAYMAPEIFESKKFDAFKADIWSLGVLFYGMSTGCDFWKDGSTDKSKWVDVFRMGMFDFTDCVGNMEFIACVKKMLSTTVKTRASLKWLMKKDIFKESKGSRSLLKADLIVKQGSFVLGSSSNLRNILDQINAQEQGNVEPPNISYSPSKRLVGSKRRRVSKTLLYQQTFSAATIK